MTASLEEDWRRRLARPAAILEIGGFRPTDDASASFFGAVRLDRPGAEWPRFGGEPLVPLCQINLLSAPLRPDPLADVEMISVFEAVNDTRLWERDTTDDGEAGDAAWVVRCHPSIADLVPLDDPGADRPRPKAFECRWGDVFEDYPTHDLLPDDLPEKISEAYYEFDWSRTAGGLKVGGYPACIQSEPWWDYRAGAGPFDFCLQIDSTEKGRWVWGDSGCAYLARFRERPELWAIDVQCY